ncbi:MAG: ATP-binding protein, partial [Bacteroidia bacterium]|nr:ATP-binding protein [Bacteroidia bacterium]
IGKKTGRDVYRIDLSTVVSKYIGETEKNLRKLFDRAERKDWILFFDEADAIFGKRTSVNDAHDRYANQEVSYLLQRIEYHEGLVILATNMKNNIDSAFMRRFQCIVHFPMPKAAERYKLWQKAFPEKIVFDETFDLQKVSNDHELSGAHIVNVVSHCALKTIASGNKPLTGQMLRESIARELAKEGRTL